MLKFKDLLQETMSYETLQTWSQIFILVGILLTGLGGFGAYHYGKKIETQKDGQNSVKEKELNSKIENLIDGNNILVKSNDDLKKQLKPFEVLIDKFYPNQEKDKAIENLTREMENLKSKSKELENKIKGREISESQRGELLSKLKSFHFKKSVIIHSIMGDQESYVYAHDFKKVFIAAGWEAQVAESKYSGPKYGIQILSPVNPPNESIQELHQIIIDSRFDIVGNLDQNARKDILEIVIGMKK